jgi:hypothetical protein
MNIFIAIVEQKLATLTSEESWHCAKVLRKKTGDKVPKKQIWFIIRKKCVD